MGNTEVKDFAPVQAHERKELNLSRKVTHKQFVRHVRGELSENCLFEIPWAIRDSVALYEKMDISFNRITDFPVELPLRLPHLSVINLSYNQLESLPESIGLLFHLRVAILNNNRLTTVPDSILHLVKLEKVDLSNNRIKTLPEGIGRMESLKKLNLLNNKLKTLPLSLGQSHTVEVLLAKKNRCENPPQTICDEGSIATLAFLRKQCSPNGHIEITPKVKVNTFPRVRGNQLQYAVPNPQSALVEYIQTQTNTTNTPSRVKTPLLPPLDATTLEVHDLRDKILGLLYGAAIGDALGITCENMKPDECQFYYDADTLTYDDVIRDEHRTKWKPADWTTDFDQLALVLESLAHWAGVVDELDFAKRLSAWSSEGFRELGDTEGIVACNTMSKVLNDARFQDDPHGVARALVENTKEEEPDAFADNGALARAIPLGIPHFYKLEEVSSNASRICQATHYDPRSVASSVMVACTTALMLQGKHDLKKPNELEEMVSQARDVAFQYLTDSQHKKDMEKAIRCKDYLSVEIHEPERVSFAFKPLACALAALRMKKDFKSSLTELVMQGGDSNANGCMAGAFLGCRTGFIGLPTHWVDALREPQISWINVRINLLLDMMGIP